MACSCEQLVGIEREFCEIDVRSELVVGLGEATATRGKPLEVSLSDQHGNRIPAPGQFDSLAALCLPDEPRQVATGLRYRMAVMHESPFRERDGQWRFLSPGTP